MSELHRINPEITDPKVDVIFVHGLGGDPFSTWQHGSDKEDSWPFWLAREIPQAAVWTLGYDAAWHQWFGAAAMPLPNRADDVLGELVRNAIGSRPVVFVCHSLGGLLAKQVLENAATLNNPLWQPIAQQTHAVVFVATPHAGAELANLLSRMGAVLGSSPAIHDLRAHNSHLLRLNTWYRQNAPVLGISTLCYFETRDTKVKKFGFLPWGGVRVVEQGDASPGITDVFASPLDADHFAICKPSRSDARLCHEVAEAVRAALSRPAGPLGVPDPGTAVTEDGAGIVDPLALPADLGDYQDRGAKQQAILEALTGGERLAAITAIGGLGGIGKTALAVHAANQLRDSFPGGVRYIDLQGVSERPLDPVDAMGRIVRSFEPTLGVPDDEAQAAGLYRQMLDGKRVLLLLDNARDGAQVFSLLKHRAPETAIIVTSRNREIGFNGLKRFDLDQMTENEARVFLREMLGPERATDDELDALATRAGHLPLALRVAGRFLQGHPGWSVRDYMEALDAAQVELKLEGETDKDVLAVLGFSAQQLERDDPDLAQRWRQLQVFPADFDRAAAAAVWDLSEAQARTSLDALIGRSMLLLDETTRRHRLHDLMRQVAERATTAEDDLPAACARHAGRYAAVLTAAGEMFLQGNEGVLVGLQLYDLEQANISAGQSWAAQNGARDEEIAGLSAHFGETLGAVNVLGLRLHPREWIAWLEAQLAACRRLGNRQGEGAALGNLGLAYAALGEVRRAIEHYEQQLAITREIGDRRGEGAALGNLGNAYAELGEVRRAIEHYEGSLEIKREIGDRAGEGRTMFNTALLERQSGDGARAVALAEDALAIFEAIGAQHHVATVRAKLAEWQG